MSKSNQETVWTPLEKALDQARDLNDKAVQFARETADDVRDRSERTLKLVRTNIEEAQKNFEKQSNEFELGKLPEVVRTQLQTIEEQVRKGVEAVAKSLDIATTREVDALRRKLSNLEKRVAELSRESATARPAHPVEEGLLVICVIARSRGAPLSAPAGARGEPAAPARLAPSRASGRVPSRDESGERPFQAAALSPLPLPLDFFGLSSDLPSDFLSELSDELLSDESLSDEEPLSARFEDPLLP